MPRVRDADAGGVLIPDSVQQRTKKRILQHAEKMRFAGKFTRIDVSFWESFCYIDAFREPDLAPGWPPSDWPESREEYLERLRATPIHLCRLRYSGNEESWEFALFAYSSEKYELMPSGDFYGTPEEAFDAASQCPLD